MDNQDIWVFVEIKKDDIRGVSFELLGKAKELAKNSDDKVCVIILGKDGSKFCEDLSYYDVDKIYLCENEILEEYLTETYSLTLVELIKKYLPNIILFPATKIGRDLAPRVAATLETGLTADCIDLKVQNGNLVQTRSVYGGNYLVDIICPSKRPQITSIRPNVMDKSEPTEKNQPEIIEFSVDIDPNTLKTKLIEKIETTVIDVKPIDEADIIV